MFRDLEVNPVGEASRRPEYDSLYKDRPSQFEHTTNDDDRLVLTGPTLYGHTLYRTHAAKHIAIGLATPPAETVFVMWQEISVSADRHWLRIARGVRTGDDIVWDANPAHILLVMQTTGTAANDWIEASMVMNAAKTAIYVAVSHYTDPAVVPGSVPTVSLYTITDIYNANFSAATVTATIPSIAASADIGRHIDIEIGNGDNLMICWWRFYTTQYKIDYCYGTAGAMGAPATYDNGKGVGFDMMGFSLVRDPSTAATNNFYLSFLENQGVTLYKIYYQLFTIGVATGSATQVTASAYSEGVLYRIVVVSAIDIDGTKHWLYRTAVTTLTHTYEDVTP